MTAKVIRGSSAKNGSKNSTFDHRQWVKTYKTFSVIGLRITLNLKNYDYR